MTEQYQYVLVRCGRPTNHGEPCGQPRHSSAVVGCRFHLTDEERERIRRQARTVSPWPTGADLPAPPCLSESERVALEAERERLAREPACWSWPTPEPREYATEREAAEALELWQLGHGCAICGPGWDLVTDHDHETGLVRGNLCGSCNVKEGWGNDTPPFTKYRQRNPATILGVQVRYWSAAGGLAQPVRPSPLLTTEALRDASDRLSLPSPESLRDEPERSEA